MAKLDLNKLKAEIDTRKTERGIVTTRGGDTVNNGAPRDTFLYGLLESLNSGRETASSALVKSVDNKVAVKNKETARLPINEAAIPVTKQTPRLQQEYMDSSPERDELLYRDIELKRKQTLAEAISNGIAPQGVNRNQLPTYNPNTGQPMQINEGYLVENVKKIVDNYLIDNFGPIVEEAIRSTIIEMYAVNRIKDVLSENKEMIKSLVYEIIREIQLKNKAKIKT